MRMGETTERPSDVRVWGVKRAWAIGVIASMAGIAAVLGYRTVERGSARPERPGAAAVRSAGVERDGTEATETGDAASRSPADVVLTLQRLHERRDYEGLAVFLEQDARVATVEFLKAVDEVIDAHARTEKLAEAAYGPLTAETWSVAVEDNLGPFSKRVRLIGQQFLGDSAEVTLQEGDNVPVVHAKFVYDGQGWRYRPDRVRAGAPGELRRLAAILRDVGDAIEGGATYEHYCDAFVYRLLPQMDRVVTGGREVASRPATTVAAGAPAD